MRANNQRKGDFTMLQYSVYIRHIPSGENADVHERRIRKFLPPAGNIFILRITDKQYNNILNFWGRSPEGMHNGAQ